MTLNDAHLNLMRRGLATRAVDWNWSRLPAATRVPSPKLTRYPNINPC
jgi:hypothetical protein